MYPDILTSADVAAGIEVKLDISIELETERSFEIVSNIVESSPAPSSSQIQPAQGGITTKLTHLPPLLVTVLLPPEYPTAAGPVLRSVIARHAWLAPAQVRRLGARLEGRWREAVERGERDEGILWAWVEDIRSGAFLEAMGESDRVPSTVRSRGKSPAAPDTAITLPHSAPKTLYAHLIAHQSAAREAQFSAQAFTCGICLAPQRGARCIQIPCEHAHVFCLECLKAFWGLCVSEGDVSRVSCPGVECAQAKGREGEEPEEAEESAAVGSEWEQVVRRVLSEEQVERWKWLRIKQAAEKGESRRFPSCGDRCVLCLPGGRSFALVWTRSEYGAVPRPDVSGAGTASEGGGGRRVRVGPAPHVRCMWVCVLRWVSPNVVRFCALGAVYAC